MHAMNTLCLQQCRSATTSTTTTAAAATAAARDSSSSSLAVKCRRWRQRLVTCTARRQQQQHCGSSSGNPSTSSSPSAALRPAVPSALSATNVEDTFARDPTYGSSSSSSATSSSSSSSSMPVPGDTLEVTCDRLGVGGVGVCLWGASRLVVLVRGALPGEVLLTRVTAVRKGYAEGIKTATLHPHANATTPNCQHFGACGGCSLQNLLYEAQLHHKTEHVAQLFTRVGKLNPSLVQATRLNPVAAAEARRYQYRNKVQLAFSTRVWQRELDARQQQQQQGYLEQQQQQQQQQPGAVQREGSTRHRQQQQQQQQQHVAQQQQQGQVVDGWGLGFYLPGSNSVVMPVEQCSLVPPEFNAVIETVRTLLSQQQQLQPYNPVTGSGLLRHLIIRSAAAAGHDSTAAAAAWAAACDIAVANGDDPPAAAAAATSAGQQGPATAANLMVVFVTTDGCQPSLLQPLCTPLMEACPSVISVVHSTEAAAAAGPGTYDPLDLDLDRQNHRVSNLAPAAKAAAVALQRGSGGGRQQRNRNKTSSRKTKQQQQQQQQQQPQKRGAHALTVSSTTVLAGAPYLVEILCGLHFHISPHSFFQTNTQQAELLYEEVVMAVQDYYTYAQALQQDDIGSTAAAAAAVATAGAAGDQQGSGSSSSSSGSSSSSSGSSSSRSTPRQRSGVVLDLYCGTGTITLSLAHKLQQHCKQIIGFDVSESSIADARANALRNGTTNATFVCGDLTKLVRGELVPEPWNTMDSKPDVVVVDPARAGLSRSVVDYLVRCGAGRVVYVSCNPATQARDLQLLCGSNSGSSSSSSTFGKQQHGKTGSATYSSSSSGAFQVVSWRGVDMFPQTDHLETVVVLDRV